MVTAGLADAAPQPLGVVARQNHDPQLLVAGLVPSPARARRQRQKLGIAGEDLAAWAEEERLALQVVRFASAAASATTPAAASRSSSSTTAAAPNIGAKRQARQADDQPLTAETTGEHALQLGGHCRTDQLGRRAETKSQEAVDIHHDR